MRRRGSLSSAAFLAVTFATAAPAAAEKPEAIPPLEVSTSGVVPALSPAERMDRAAAIRDTAALRGLTNGVLLGGIADAETGMAHCWSEATWACQGPTSASCGDGPVIAGAADGPCSAQQGGLGMFQFDGGTYAETLARDGHEILLVEGNIDHAVDFVVDMVIRSVYADVDTAQEAIDWMNAIPIDGASPQYQAWISTVTHYYNGCLPSYSCWDQRWGNYDAKTRGVWNEFGAGFWAAEVPECETVPADGRIIEEDDACYTAGGNPSYWRTETVGHDGRLQWTHATASAEVENFGEWTLDLEKAGTYLVEVHTDGGTYAASRQAPYEIRHAGETTVVTIDQTAVDGWQSLGELAFAAGGDQYVYLGDNTGEPLDTMTRVGFDALRLTRVDPGDDPDDPGDDPDDPGDDDPADDPGYDDPDEIGGGCSAGGNEAPRTLAMVGFAVLVAARRRRRDDARVSE